MTLASTSSAKCISRLLKGLTSMSALKRATSVFSIATRSAVENSGPLSSFCATPMTSRSTSLIARPMMSMWPFVTGSKVPGYSPMRMAFASPRFVPFSRCEINGLDRLTRV
ncbi:hypothetical protein D3C81_1647810 [compost metagenome]